MADIQTQMLDLPIAQSCWRLQRIIISQRDDLANLEIEGDLKKPREGRRREEPS